MRPDGPGDNRSLRTENVSAHKGAASLIARFDLGGGLLWLLPVIILLLHTALLVFLACRHSPVLDERARITSGRLGWQTGLFVTNPGNPPLNDLIAASPVALGLMAEQQEKPEQLLDQVIAGRLALIPFSILGAWVCFVWSRDLFGRTTAIFCMLLWCTDPLILSHGALITGDMLATSVGLAGLYAFWNWMQQPSLSRSVVCGIVLGFVLLSKYVWIVMPLLWGVLWVIRRLLSVQPQLRGLLACSVVMAVAAIYVINAGYAFDSTLMPWRTFQFRNPLLQQFCVDPTAETGVSSWLGAIPVPVPASYIMGIDEVADHLETASFPTYVMGHFHDGNVWWFHAYGLLVKMPLGTWLLLVLALYSRMFRPRTKSDSASIPNQAQRPESGNVDSFGRDQTSPGLFESRHWFTDVVLWLPALTILLFVSWVTQIKLLRYILPMLPFALIWTGHAFVWAQHGSRWRKAIVYSALSFSVLSSLSIYPHSLSYFNEASGGTASGHSHLIWASFDWGQDILFFKDWVNEHPKSQPLYVGFHAAIAPELVGISSRSLPWNGPQEGWYAISASVLRGIQRPRNPEMTSAGAPTKYLDLFLRRKPIDRVAYSIFIYHLDCQQANEMREELGLEKIDCKATDR